MSLLTISSQSNSLSGWLRKGFHHFPGKTHRATNDFGRWGQGRGVPDSVFARGPDLLWVPLMPKYQRSLPLKTGVRQSLQKPLNAEQERAPCPFIYLGSSRRGTEAAPACRVNPRYTFGGLCVWTSGTS